MSGASRFRDLGQRAAFMAELIRMEDGAPVTTETAMKRVGRAD